MSTSHKRYNAYNPLATPSELWPLLTTPLNLADRLLEQVGRMHEQLNHLESERSRTARRAGPFG
ncbi:hypothetical protein GH975_03490 [Litorivicinus lipolyticus]|uniref:Uncharacterized protein n=1 Tax=Litorivicinus lipolyticus TaxID=418701 RepID=A0A5Q2QCW2_9GAMM|nr:hypothetical protein [Litorivicinus lipolyticus]QGG79680.1 hypothetical protein GH975_03490 [Litorivicinus lipolyticus]